MRSTFIIMIYLSLLAVPAAIAGEAPAAAKTLPTGNVPEIRSQATGFFRVETQPDGRWWLIAPDGCGYVSFGIDHCNYRGHFSHKDGFYRYRRNNDEKYMTEAEKAAVARDRQAADAAVRDRAARDREAGPNPPPYALKWGEETAARLRDWGFTAMGSTCDEQFASRGFVTRPLLRMSETFAKRGDDYHIAEHKQRASSVFPNVFHPDFPEFCEAMAREKCAPNRDNPWYLGYYIDNELAWWGTSSRTLPVGLFNLVMKKNGTHTAKQALREFLRRESGDDIAQFNRVWNTQLSSFDEISDLTALPETTPEQVAIKERFLALIADTYFRITTEAIRKADPNHLILGCRFADVHGGVSPVVWQAAGKYCDVITVNCYPTARLDENCVYTDDTPGSVPMTEMFDRLRQWTGRPMIITEWSFPALDSGLPCTYGAGQRFSTQSERVAACRLFARTMLSHPAVVGYDYFMWCDEPATGILASFPENSNYGLVNEQGEPYQELADMFSEIHREPARLRLADPPAARLVTRNFADAGKAAARIARSIKASGRSVFSRDGDNYTLSNGKISLSGKIGSPAVFDRVAAAGDNGSNFGEFTVMVQEKDVVGKSFWRRPRKIAAASGRNLTDGSAEATITALGWSYLLVIKVVLPPDSEVFLTEPVSLKNVAKKDFAVTAVFLRLTGGDGFGPAERFASRLWNSPPLGCWVHPDGRFLGSAAPVGSDYRIVFYQNKDSLSADARLLLPKTRTLAPNETIRFQPPRTGAMLHYLGTGGREEFLARVKATAEFLK